MSGVNKPCPTCGGPLRVDRIFAWKPGAELPKCPNCGSRGQTFRRLPWPGSWGCYRCHGSWQSEELTVPRYVLNPALTPSESNHEA